MKQKPLFLLKKQNNLFISIFCCILFYERFFFLIVQPIPLFIINTTTTPHCVNRLKLETNPQKINTAKNNKVNLFFHSYSNQEYSHLDVPSIERNILQSLKSH